MGSSVFDLGAVGGGGCDLPVVDFAVELLLGVFEKLVAHTFYFFAVGDTQYNFVNNKMAGVIRVSYTIPDMCCIYLSIFM